MFKLKCCIKFDFGWGSPQTLLGEFTAPLRPLAGFRGPISEGKSGRGEDVGEGRDGREWKKENGKEAKGE